MGCDLWMGLTAFDSASVPRFLLEQLRTAMSQTAAPAEKPLPAGWASAQDPSSGNTYYYNEAGETTWEVRTEQRLQDRVGGLRCVLLRVLPRAPFESFARLSLCTR